MSLSVVFTGADDGDDEPIHLCSASEWQKFVQWAKDRKDALGDLARNGRVDNTRELSRCMEEEHGKHPIIDDLHSYVGVGAKDEAMKVVE